MSVACALGRNHQPVFSIGPAPAMLPYRPGDRAWPGAAIANLPDATTLRISARVDETERGRLAPNSQLRFNSMPSPIASSPGTSNKLAPSPAWISPAAGPSPAISFLRSFSIRPTRDSSLASRGKLPSLWTACPTRSRFPAQAMFQKSGQNVAYVWRGTQFEERAIDVGRRSGDKIMVAKGVTRRRSSGVKRSDGERVTRSELT